MLSHRRDLMILGLLKQSESLRVSDLSQALQVSEATIRRDLDRLEKAGHLQRVHGGVLPLRANSLEPPVLQRIAENAQEKRQIGQAAARLIPNDSSIFIGSGSTALEVARNLNGRQGLTVVTNSLPIVNQLAREPGITLVATGGVMRESELSFIGHITEHALCEVRVDKVVIGIPALDVKMGLTNDYLPEVVTDRTILDLGQELILVADHSKFGKVASAYLAPLERVTTLVTDSQVNHETLEQIRKLGIHVIIADE
jgi:DeoR/GlpR family transcriptional regulator of sugar metabolism